MRRLGASGGARHGAVTFALLSALLGAFASLEARGPYGALAASAEAPAPPAKPEPIDVAVNEASAPPAAASPAVVAGDGVLAAGRQALENEGGLPPLIMDYDDVGFAPYVALLRELGATAVVISGGVEVVGEIDLTTGEISAFRPDRTYSPRARDYSDEPSVASAIERARRALDDASVTVLVAVPAAVDALLLGALIDKLDELGLEPGGFREFTGRYERTTSAAGVVGLIAHIEHGTTHAGQRHDLDVHIDIGSLAHYSHAAGRSRATG